MKPFQLSFEAIGTQWTIDVLDKTSLTLQKTLREKITIRIEDFDQVYSRFRPDSLVTYMSQKTGMYTLPADAKEILTLYQNLYQITDGLFTPLIGNVLEDAGYDPLYSLKPRPIRKPYSWEEAIEYNYPHLTIKKPVMLDVGAAGKGYLIDIIGKLLERYEITSYCIDAGGDILYKNTSLKPLRIGLENPENFQQVLGVTTIINQSICGSSGNRRNWGSYHHIINPKTLTSPHTIHAVWVTGKTALHADALSTCLFFVSSETLLQYYDFEYAIVYADYSLEKSAQFPGEFFYQNNPSTL